VELLEPLSQSSPSSGIWGQQVGFYLLAFSELRFVFLVPHVLFPNGSDIFMEFKLAHIDRHGDCKSIDNETER